MNDDQNINRSRVHLEQELGYNKYKSTVEIQGHNRRVPIKNSENGQGSKLS